MPKSIGIGVEILIPLIMFVSVLKSKIHKAKITELKLDYSGSITIDSEIMKAAKIFPNEKVLVANFSNGERFETYVIEGKKGEICINGPASHLCQKGDFIVVMSFIEIDIKAAKKYKPIIVKLDENNNLIR